MSHPYVAVRWTRFKIIYDSILIGLVVLYLLGFMQTSHWIADLKGIELETDGVAIRAYGSAAYILLHVTLAIGPLSRIQPWFHTLLFNRRHMGVMVFLLGSIHVSGWARGNPVVRIEDAEAAMAIQRRRSLVQRFRRS